MKEAGFGGSDGWGRIKLMKMEWQRWILMEMF